MPIGQPVHHDNLYGQRRPIPRLFTDMKPCQPFLPVLALCFVMISTATAEVPKPSRHDRPQILQGNLQEGETAPDFTLQDIAGKKSVKLSSLKGKPTVLIFGSCTCPRFVATMQMNEQLYKTYADRVHFYLIYVREAHPIDGWALLSNPFQIRSPQSIEERCKVAVAFHHKLKVTMPVLVDALDDLVEKNYACWPNRMYILDAQGKIVEKASAGPNSVEISARKAAAILDKLLADTK